MIFSKFRQGLEIFAKYFDRDSYRTGAEHDEFFVYATDRPISLEDVKTLVDLGWTQPESDLGEDEDFNASHYNPGNGWHAHT